MTKRLLIVEDDPEIARLTAMYLEAEGYETKVVHDGLEAIPAMKLYQPHLVILDLMLPGIGGIKSANKQEPFIKNLYWF